MAFIDCIAQEATALFTMRKIYGSPAELREEVRVFPNRKGFAATTYGMKVCCSTRLSNLHPQRIGEKRVLFRCSAFGQVEDLQVFRSLWMPLQNHDRISLEEVFCLWTSLSIITVKGEWRDIPWIYPKQSAPGQLWNTTSLVYSTVIGPTTPI